MRAAKQVNATIRVVMNASQWLFGWSRAVEQYTSRLSFLSIHSHHASGKKQHDLATGGCTLCLGHLARMGGLCPRRCSCKVESGTPRSCPQGDRRAEDR